MRIPDSLRLWLENVPQRQAKQVWEWLQTNSNTVIVDELELVIDQRKDMKKITNP